MRGEPGRPKRRTGCSSSIRATATTVGDLLAHIFGLPVGTAATGLMLAGVLTLWGKRSKAPLSRV